MFGLPIHCAFLGAAKDMPILIAGVVARQPAKLTFSWHQRVLDDLRTETKAK